MLSCSAFDKNSLFRFWKILPPSLTLSSSFFLIVQGLIFCLFFLQILVLQLEYQSHRTVSHVLLLFSITVSLQCKSLVLDSKCYESSVFFSSCSFCLVFFCFIFSFYCLNIVNLSTLCCYCCRFSLFWCRSESLLVIFLDLFCLVVDLTTIAL